MVKNETKGSEKKKRVQNKNGIFLRGEKF